MILYNDRPASAETYSGIEKLNLLERLKAIDSKARRNVSIRFSFREQLNDLAFAIRQNTGLIGLRPFVQEMTQQHFRSPDTEHGQM